MDRLRRHSISLLDHGRSLGHIRADAQYVDESISDFVSHEGLPVVQPSYELVNMRFGMDLTERLAVTLSVDNVFDERPVLDTVDYRPAVWIHHVDLTAAHVRIDLPIQRTLIQSSTFPSRR